MSRTRSATLATSIIEPRSFGHSMMVRRRFLPVVEWGQQGLIDGKVSYIPVTTVTGPLTSAMVFLV